MSPRYSPVLPPTWRVLVMGGSILALACNRNAAERASPLALEEPTIECQQPEEVRRAFWQQVNKRPERWRGPLRGGVRVLLHCGPQGGIAGSLELVKADFPSLADPTLRLVIEPEASDGSSIAPLAKALRVWEVAIAVGHQQGPAQARSQALAVLLQLDVQDSQASAAAQWLFQWLVDSAASEVPKQAPASDAKTLLRWLAHDDPDLRAAALDAFGVVGGQDDVPDLLLALQAERQVSLVRIYEALANLGGPEATDYLGVAAQSEPDPAAREVAELALRRLRLSASADTFTPSVSPSTVSSPQVGDPP